MSRPPSTAPFIAANTFAPVVVRARPTSSTQRNGFALPSIGSTVYISPVHFSCSTNAVRGKNTLTQCSPGQHKYRPASASSDGDAPAAGRCNRQQRSLSDHTANTSAIPLGRQAQAHLDTVSRQFVRVGNRVHAIARHFGGDDLADNILLREAHYQAVLWRVVLVLSLDDESLARIVVSLALCRKWQVSRNQRRISRTATSTKLHLIALEVRLVLDDFDEAHRAGSFNDRHPMRRVRCGKELPARQQSYQGESFRMQKRQKSPERRKTLRRLYAQGKCASKLFARATVSERRRLLSHARRTAHILHQRVSRQKFGRFSGGFSRDLSFRRHSPLLQTRVATRTVTDRAAQQCRRVVCRRNRCVSFLSGSSCSDEPPLALQKKAHENINARLALVMKSGKVCLGYKQTIKSIRSGKAKLVILAQNTPPLRCVYSTFHVEDIRLRPFKALGN